MIGPVLLLALALGGAGVSAHGQTVRPKRDSSSVSDLLRPPGSGTSYGEPVDWQAVPPWRQTSFFGLRAQGQLFVYVVDCSGSMADAGRIARAKAELRRSIEGLRYPQRFLVVFYNDEPIPMAGGLPLSADLNGKSRLLSFLRAIDADGDTDPRAAMRIGLGVKPDAVFLLTDGEYPEGTAAAIGAANRNHVPIHTIDLTGRGNPQLQQIARESGGQYLARP